jgi:hypothetical protein
MTSAQDADTPEQPFGIVWRLRDQQKLERELEIAFGRAPIYRRSALAAFQRELQSHALEWPLASRRASEQTWRFDKVEIRYRLIPSDQAVEILSVTGPHTH